MELRERLAPVGPSGFSSNRPLRRVCRLSKRTASRVGGPKPPGNLGYPLDLVHEPVVGPPLLRALISLAGCALGGPRFSVYNQPDRAWCLAVALGYSRLDRTRATERPALPPSDLRHALVFRHACAGVFFRAAC